MRREEKEELGKYIRYLQQNGIEVAVSKPDKYYRVSVFARDRAPGPVSQVWFAGTGRQVLWFLRGVVLGFEVGLSSKGG
ncbi:MAG: hypothetical protein QXK45_02915 [Thermofilaceae archaeon]